MAVTPRDITGVNDGSDLFPDNTSSSVNNSNQQVNVINKASAGNLPIDATDIDANHVLYSVDGTDYKSVNLNTLGLGGGDTAFLGDLEFVASKGDLPTPVGGIITLLANKTYFFTSNVDLTGDRLVASQNTVILGGSSENAIITSTGLGAGIPLLYSEWTLPIRHVAFKDVDTALEIQGATNQPVALDWTGVNFVNVPNVGLINTCDNWIFDKGAFLNSQGLKFSGTIGTVGVGNSIFVGQGSAGSIIELLPNTTISRRFRIIYSAVVAFGSTTAITVDNTVTIPTESYILDNVNFSGGGTYTAGVSLNDVRTRFTASKGVLNTAEVGNYYFNNNVTTTAITTQGVATKILGTSIANPINQKFTHSDNRLTYVGGLLRDFQITAIMTVEANQQNQEVGFYVTKNGIPLPDSEMYVSTDSRRLAENCAIHTITEMSPNDYIEIWIENNNDDTDLLVQSLNVIVKSLN